MRNMEEIKSRLRESIMGRFSMDRELSDDEVRDIIDGAIMESGRSLGLSLEEKKELAKDMFYTIRRLDILQELTDDPRVTEIMINGKDHIFIERDGKLFRWDKSFSSEDKLEDVIQQIVARCNRTVNESSPIVDARLENG